MSSILDALEKIEKTRGPEPPRHDDGGGGRWRVVALVVLALAVAGGTAAFILGQGEDEAAEGDPIVVAAVTPSTMPAPPPTVKVVPTTVPMPTTLAVPTTTAIPTTAPVVTTLPAVSTTVPTTLPTTSTTIVAAPAPPAPPAPPVVASAPRPAAPVRPPDARDRERPWGAEPAAPSQVLPVARTAPETRPTATTLPARAEPPAPKPRPGVPPGAPKLRVSFLVYSATSERRSVALTINDGSLTTLREGGTSDGVEVVRILPDRVELRWQGETFTLEVRS